MRALTALRGIAAWWVVGFHFREGLPAGLAPMLSGALSSGYLAVDLFFILSGYVIALNYGAWFGHVRFSAPVYRRFLALRLSRIYPLHLTILLAFLINPLAVQLFSHHAADGAPRWGYFGLSLLLMQEWGFMHGLAWNVPAWSISAEWLAYLIFPALAAGFSVLAPRRRPACALACVAALLGGLALLAARHGGSGLGYDAEWFALARCVIEFSAGICLCAAAAGMAASRALSWLALGLAMIGLAAYAWLGLPDYAIMPLSFAALILALLDERGTLAKVLRLRVLQWLGLVSYSTYLSHYLLKIWVKFAFVRPAVPAGVAFLAYVAAVLLASAVLYRCIERPGQVFLRRLLVRNRGTAVS